MEVKKGITIFGLSIWRIMLYFIIYSVLGYIIETIFGLLTLGVIESRQSFLYGPFCGIYGIGATVMIIGMQKVPKTYNWLFVAGFILGTVTEYTISIISKKIAGVTWWDYSSMPLNINGRVCLLYSIFWGLLAIYLMGYLNPKLDKMIEYVKGKVSIKILKALVLSTFIFIVIEFFATAIAIQVFLIRIEKVHNLDVQNKEQTLMLYEQIYGNPKLADFIYKYWGDSKMIKTFPNLKIEDREGRTIYVNKLLPNIKPYYINFKKE